MQISPDRSGKNLLLAKTERAYFPTLAMPASVSNSREHDTVLPLFLNRGSPNEHTQGGLNPRHLSSHFSFAESS